MRSCLSLGLLILGITHPLHGQERAHPYRTLAADVQRALHESLYDPSLLTQQQWVGFLDSLRVQLDTAQDADAVRLSAGSVAAHLLAESTSAGVFLGTGWYGGHHAIPTTSEMPALPVVDRDDLPGFVRLLRSEGAVTVRIIPAQPRFTGQVYVLVNHKTASACEPILALLRDAHRAIIIGEPSAGAMLSALPHPVGNGWVLVLPEADYFTARGQRLEGAGVAPDINVPGDQAMVTALVRAREARARDRQ